MKSRNYQRIATAVGTLGAVLITEGIGLFFHDFNTMFYGPMITAPTGSFLMNKLCEPSLKEIIEEEAPQYELKKSN